jgi:hypothetical protein
MPTVELLTNNPGERKRAKLPTDAEGRWCVPSGTAYCVCVNVDDDHAYEARVVVDGVLARRFIVGPNQSGMCDDVKGREGRLVFYSVDAAITAAAAAALNVRGRRGRVARGGAPANTGILDAPDGARGLVRVTRT